MRCVGFLDNPKRLNVALTRAQTLLIVLGNVNTLWIDSLWRKFIDFCDENGLIGYIGEDKEEFFQKKDVNLKDVFKNASDLTTNVSGGITLSQRHKLDNNQMSSKKTKYVNKTLNQPHSKDSLKLRSRSIESIDYHKIRDTPNHQLILYKPLCQFFPSICHMFLIMNYLATFGILRECLQSKTISFQIAEQVHN